MNTVDETGNRNLNESRDWRIVHAEVRHCGQRRDELDALEARLLREAQSLRIWEQVGCATMLEYLERELGYTPRDGRDRLRIARALGDLPNLEASLARGELKHSAVRELVRVVKPETEQAWLDRTKGASVREIEALVSGRSPGDLPDDPPSSPDEQARDVTFRDLSAQTRALLRQVRVVLADETGHSLDDDAFLTQLLGGALQGSSSKPDRPSHQVAVTECKCGRAWQHGAGRTFELDAADLERAKCDATYIGSLDADEPERAKSDIPPAVRRLVLHRDGYACTVPGCRSSRFLELHHLEHRAHGGSHRPENITTVCGAHHQQGHRGTLKISGQAPDRLVFESETLRRKPRVEPTTRFSDATLETQTRDALVTMGFAAKEAREAIASARVRIGGDARLEDFIRTALRYCRRPLS